MKDKKISYEHYYPINEKEYKENIEEIKKASNLERIDRYEEEERIRELERRARIERNHKQRVQRKEYYHTRLGLSIAGIGLFALLSGYWVANVQIYAAQGKEEILMVDGLVTGTLESGNLVYEDWKLRVVNQWNPLSLVKTPSLEEVSDGIVVDARIVESLNQMIRTGKTEAGLDILILNGYRSKADEVDLFNVSVEAQIAKGKSYLQAYEAVCKDMALPGTSEYSLGLVVDLLGRDYQKFDEKQSDTAVAKWLESNCQRFGFILRYPEGKEDVTGRVYVSWNFRYVGEAAVEIMERGITLEEYLDIK